MTDLERAREAFSGDRFAAELVGCVIEEVRPGYARCSLHLDARHKNALGRPMLAQAVELGAETELALVTAVRREGNFFCVVTDGGEFRARAVVLAAGVKHRRLGLPGEDELIGNGLSFCAVCDGAFYNARPVAVMDFFDALLHSFASAGTGGFSTKVASVGYYNSAYIDIVIGTFLILFGVNFNLYYLILIGHFKSALKSDELRTYLGIIAFAVLTIALNIMLSTAASISFSDAVMASISPDARELDRKSVV